MLCYFSCISGRELCCNVDLFATYNFHIFSGSFGMDLIRSDPGGDMLLPFLFLQLVFSLYLSCLFSCIFSGLAYLFCAFVCDPYSSSLHRNLLILYDQLRFKGLMTALQRTVRKLGLRLASKTLLGHRSRVALHVLHCTYLCAKETAANFDPISQPTKWVSV